MSVAKVIEISAESSSSLDDAISQGIKKAGRSVEGIRSAWVKDWEMMIKDNAVAGYRVKLKLTFELKD
jgi:flavin-binding protein dodecin